MKLYQFCMLLDVGHIRDDEWRMKVLVIKIAEIQ
jgi:hypothetical protein